MKIAIVHNAYRLRGGEDTVVDKEFELLSKAGHDVSKLVVTNDSITGQLSKVRAFLSAPYDQDRGRAIRELAIREKFDVVHVHNFFPLLSPAIHEGAADAGAAVVQTLHNYRLTCAGATLLRDGRICTKCLDSNYAWGAIHRCYRNSIPGSLALVAMQYRAKARGTWKRVHRFIALTEGGKEIFQRSGLDEDRISIKPHFTTRRPMREGSDYAVFVGRLSQEKGVRTLIDAWHNVSNLNLLVIGDGPDLAALKASAPNSVKFMGSLSPDDVQTYLSRASMMIVPSICLETFGMVVIEAFSQGIPVVASDIGALREIIRPGENGQLFEPGNVSSLVSTIASLLHFPDQLISLGHGARRSYDELYTPERNLVLLEKIYQSAIEQAAFDNQHLH